MTSNRIQSSKDNYLAIIHKKKSLLFFSLSSTAISWLLLIIAVIPLYHLEMIALKTHHISGTTYLVFFIVLTLFFTIRNFIELFFTTGLMRCILDYLLEKSFSIRIGLKTAKRLSLKLLWWNLISSTLGVIARFSEYWSDKWHHTAFATHTLKKQPWKIASLFVLPILITKPVSPMQALSQSATCLAKRKIPNFPFNLMLLFFRFLSFLPLIVAVFVGIKHLVLICLFLSMIIFSIISAIQNTHKIIFMCEQYLNIRE